MKDYPKVEKGIFDTVKNNTEQFLKIVEQYFPEAIKDGEVDFDALKEEMGEFKEVSSEHYDFTWAGKQAAKKEAQADIYGRTLKFKPEDSVNADTTENLYIEGDNLKVLKLLKKNYYGKIKMIYIDPPYNTGNDFVYKDDFSMTENELAELSGDVINGQRLQKNKKDGSRYHTNWLNMMYPRLKIARDLLSDDGVIFISIDDNELNNILNISNDIFGEKNRIAIIAVEISKTQGMKVAAAQDGQLVKNHEYVLCYAKNINKQCKHTLLYDIAEPWDSHFNCIIKSINGKFTREELSEYIYNKDKHIYDKFEKLGYTKKCKINTKKIGNAIQCDDTIKNYFYKEMGAFIYQEMACSINVPENIKVLLEKGEIVEYGKYLLTMSSGGKIRQYRNLEENLHISDEYNSEYCRTTIRGALWKGFYSDMMNVAKEGNIEYKNGKKPIRLMKQLAKWLGCKSGDIIMDFFSGSSSTAHAIMQLNAEDGGNRKFIMVQLQESLEESLKKTSQKDEKAAIMNAIKLCEKINKPHNICEIGKERIRRAAKKIHEDNPNAVFDDGFKVFKVADTNIRWNKINDKDLLNVERLTTDKDKIDFTDGYTDIDVVYEIMLKQYGIPLSTPIEKMTDISHRTYMFADSIVVCLEANITSELIEKLAAIEPTPAKYILRDSAFGDDIEFKDVSYRRLSTLIANHQTIEEKKSRYNSYTVEFI